MQNHEKPLWQDVMEKILAYNLEILNSRYVTFSDFCAREYSDIYGNLTGTWITYQSMREEILPAIRLECECRMINRICNFIENRANDPDEVVNLILSGDEEVCDEIDELVAYGNQASMFSFTKMHQLIYYAALVLDGNRQLGEK